MTDVISMIAAGMRADAEALRVVAQNVANSEAVAYRRQILVARPAFASLLGDAETATAVAAPELATATDRRPGALRQTGEPLHAALDGPGFFVVDAGQGPVLTRNGDWRLDRDGRVVTAGGALVLGSRGPIVPGDGPVTITADGTVRVRDRTVDQLQLIVPAEDAPLQSLGGGLFALSDATPLNGNPSVHVRQGFLESSNVSLINEMVQMMETVRHSESMQRLARTYDSMLDKAISELGKV